MMERLNHALHNEKVCEVVCQNGFYDWAITTAFYSALHFVQHKIFPINEKTKDGHKFKVSSFNQYYKAFNIHGKSKHELLIDLVQEHCAAIAPEYIWLHDTCRNARYHQHNIKEPTAIKAKEWLKKIKEYCNPPAVEVKST
jgi:hypothetical protein